jgi:hypothetical protein
LLEAFVAVGFRFDTATALAGALRGGLFALAVSGDRAFSKMGFAL